MPNFLFGLILWLSFSPTEGVKKQEDNPYLILVSFDGFRHDYVANFDTPNFDQFISEGIAAESLIPSFPSKTFPNHYSIVTGMYPGNHGLVDNTFYDAKRNEIYSISNRERVSDAYYYNGKPIWTLAKENGIRTASFFWVGTEAPIGGSYPDYYMSYDSNIPNKERVKQIMTWLKLPEAERPQFLSLYFSLLDDIGHKYGPGSKEVAKAVSEADKLLGHLMREVEKVDLPINIIVTSDHGMKDMVTEKNQYVSLDDLVDVNNKSYLVINNGTHVHIYGKQNVLDSLYRTILPKANGFNVYTKDKIPEKWHYKNYRVGDILLTSNDGRYFASDERTEKALLKYQGEHWGTHGFDPYVTPEMGAIFYAMGPNILPGKSIPSFENIHIYPFMAQILELPITHKIDGNPEILKPYLLSF